MPAYPNKPISGLINQLDAPAINRSPMEARLRGFGAGALGALSHLMGGDDPAGQMMGAVGPLGMVETSATRVLPKVVQEIIDANPAARAIYERAMGAQQAEADQYLMAQAPDVLGGLGARQEATMGELNQAQSALQGLERGGLARPIPSRTGFETAIPRNAAPPRISQPNRFGAYRGGPNPGRTPAPGFDSKFSGGY